MPANTTKYARKYYEEVVKPKRQKAQAEKQDVRQTKYQGLITVTRECPKCGKVWEETLEWNADRTPSRKKQCKQCKALVQKKYTDKPEVRERINTRLRKRYAENEDVRARRLKATKKWYDNQKGKE